MILGRASLLASDGQREAPRDRTAMLYVGGTVVASLLASLFALATRLELLGPAQTIMSADSFHQLSLLRDLIFTVGVALPSVGALGHLLSPPGTTQVVRRSETLALGAFGLGAALMIASTTVTGWPFLLLAAGACALSMAAALLQAVAFVVRRRQSPRPGERTLFAHALLVTSVAEIVTLPIAIALCVALVAEKLAGVTLWHGAGGDPALFEHWLRLVVAPLGAIALLPGIGIISDTITTATKQPLAGRRAVSAAVWALPLCGAVAALARLGGDGPVALAVASFFSLAMAVPLALIVGNWIVTLASGKWTATPELWFALGAVALFVELGLAGVPLAMLDRGPLLSATVFARARDELLLAALGFAVAAALFRTWQNVRGARPAPSSARLACIVGLVGVQLSAAAEIVAGLRGMPRAFTYPPEFHALAIIASVGCLLWIAAAGIVGAGLTATLRRR